jgi:hypothetical protein
MSRVTLTLHNPQQAKPLLGDMWSWIKAQTMAGNKVQLEAKTETRTIKQNSMMWSCLTDLSKQIDWYGQKLSPDDWKHVLTASLRKQRAVPGIDGGFVVIGLSTSKMTIPEMIEMVDLCHAFGADKGVIWSKTSLGRDAIDPETGEILQ